uniref:Uncharacterized protein n=1 Tax=Acrobeloides nanus TaxID=290746 RepID=A0A914EIE2_9BILA
MLSIWKQLRLLLWKSFVIKKKEKIWVLVEISIPVLLFALLVLIRTRNFDVLSSTCHYDAKAFPSGGLLPFMHSYLCSFSNNCQESPTTDDDTTEINRVSKQESIVIELIRWLMAFFEVIGRDPAWSKTTFYLLAESIHELALLDENRPQSFPISSFFESQDQMVEVLMSDFDYDHTMALKFRNISLTPSFFVNAFNEA